MKTIVKSYHLRIILIVLVSCFLFMRVDCKKKNLPTACIGFLHGFEADNINIHKGDAVYFDQCCTHTTNYTVTWWFTGGYPATSTSNQPIVTYNNAGNFTVKICVTDDNGMDCLEKVNYIHVSSSDTKDLAVASPAKDRSFK